ncbi:retropepsin-like aspartic protease family protein [Neorhizobium sp. NPDC001467]|uniref:retropepsin-like aspartic protease family protein n=1 Tax=Neorhizobium sp. NPDC001467 TaxID=3390595 RepID=UPI003D036C39
MLTRVIVSASLAIFVASQAPAMLDAGANANPSTTSRARHPEWTEANAAPSGNQIPSILRKEAGRVTVKASAEGHFTGLFSTNGHTLTGIIDTGATFVALGEAVARNLGVDAQDIRYDHTVATAAGDIKAARVTLPSLTVGNISLKNVEALVIGNDALPDILIGMSFLGRLSSYAVEGNTMKLVQ